MFEELENINRRPGPFEFYTAEELWTDDHTSKKMLTFHLDGDADVSSRNAGFIGRSVEWICTYFNVGAGTKIIDFGCGPGLYAARLAEKGARVTGIDFSESSIGYARSKASAEGHAINYISQNYLEFETDERFHLAVMIMCDFSALSPVQRKRMLDKFYKILEPGGYVLLDVYSLKAYEACEEAAVYEANLLDGFWSPGKYYGFLNTFKYGEQNLVLDKYTIVEKTRIRTVYNWFQSFSPEAIGKEFSASGFTIERLFSDVAGSAYDDCSKEFAIIAKKR